jgi:predicted AlkP superfamily phosphohydrolase/phosphomutase
VSDSSDRAARRVLVVGWDGAEWSRLNRLLDLGRLPVLARLLAGGCRAPLRSTIPPVTPAAWTAMATGLLPGRSGVLGFRRLDLSRPSGFDPVLASSQDLAGRTLFEHAARIGEGVTLVGWPMTWPPLPIPGGAVLAGWPRPREVDAPTWPPALSREVGPWGKGDPLPRWRSASLEDEIASAAWWDRRHAEIGCRWLRERQDRIAAVVLSGTDHLSHLLWHDPRLDDHFVRADRHLGDLILAAGDGANLMLVSDHGFGEAPPARVHLDRWLQQRGHLVRRAATPGLLGRLARTVRRGLPVRSWKRVRDRLPGRLRRWGAEQAGGLSDLAIERSTATSIELYEGWAGLRVWDQGRREELVRDLQDEPWVASVRAREELFGGPHLDRIPHLVVELAAGHRSGDRWDEGPVVESVSAEELARWPATHRRDGVLVMAGPGVRAGADLREAGVEDVGPTLLALAGVPIPDDLDGRVLTEAVLGAPRYMASGARVATSARPEASRGRIEQELRRLGYLD